MNNEVQMELTRLELELKRKDLNEKLNDDTFSSFHESCENTMKEVSIMLSAIEKLENDESLSDTEIENVTNLYNNPDYYSQAQWILIEAGV